MRNLKRKSIRLKRDKKGFAFNLKNIPIKQKEGDVKHDITRV